MAPRRRAHPAPAAPGRKFLFVHQNFPGQFLHLVQHLVQQGQHDVVFITEANSNMLPGVRKVVYQMPRRPAPILHSDAAELEQALVRAQMVRQTAQNLKSLGFVPDIIIGHHGWGELLNIGDVFPGVKLIGYYEFFYHIDGVDVNFDAEFSISAEAYPRIRAKNCVNLLALNNPGIGQTPTRWQLSTYPEWAQSNITLLPEGVRLDLCRPAEKPLGRSGFRLGSVAIPPGAKLVTYVARNLEPYRGFHTMMRALAKILAARPDTHAILVGGDDISYGSAPPEGTWRNWMLRELGARLDAGRVHFVGKIGYEDYRLLLQRSDAHVYLTYPFVASWSLREAMASGCAVVGGDTATVQEFVTDRQTGLIAPTLDAVAVAERVLEILEDSKLARTLRRNARAWAEQHLDLAATIDASLAMIARVLGDDPAPCMAGPKAAHARG